ncbi:MAG: CCA tRNA nucleotidyltransferase, partial [Chloroflexi bacterium]|nr:CCA tRNA nucleotidyltransferase [Chloroflexota bacterium]
MNLSAELERWLPAPTRELLTLIGHCAAQKGYRACLVGGAVRDLLLGETSLDLDIVVEGDALDVTRSLATSGGPAPVFHQRFGTATLVSGSFRVDLATARNESYHRPGALPSVRPGSIEQDLLRRDFTMNAMAVRLGTERHGELVDPYGGRGDLQHGLLRVLHEASFKDDATRMLRGVRYEQRLGFAFEKFTLALLTRELPYVKCISGDRLRHEIEHMLAEREPEQMLWRLGALGVLAAIDESLDFGPGQFEAFRRAKANRLTAARSELLFWCVLGWGLDKEGLASVATRLNLPGRLLGPMQDSFLLRVFEADLDRPGLRPSDVVGLLCDKSTASLSAAELLYGRSLARSRVSLYLTRLRHIRPALDGRMLRQLGFVEGPAIGSALARLRVARLNGEVGSREQE